MCNCWVVVLPNEEFKELYNPRVVVPLNEEFEKDINAVNTQEVDE